MIFSYLNLQGEKKLFAVLIILSLIVNLPMSSLAKRISHFQTTTLSNSKSKTNQHTKPKVFHQLLDHSSQQEYRKQFMAYK